MRAVVSIQSTKADGDAQFIKEVFPGLFEQEDEDETGGSHAIVLVSEHCTIFIRPFHTTTSAICCVKDLQVLIISSETVASHIRFQLFDGSQVGELRLPSGAAILIINVDLMQSKSGRRMVSQWLVKPTRQIDINDNPSIAQTPESTLSRLPKFRSLQVALMGASGSTQFALNSRDPVDFETDLFKGRVMCVLRPDDPNDDPYWNERIFSQKKRRMLLNVQGKFKYKPQGIVYAGAEISKPMKLGLVTRGLAGVLLKLVETFISGVHSSFGNGEELAHIVAPAFTFFERLVVTPPGQAPPILDGIIDEPAESLMKRRKSKDTGNWNTIDTYTFSFYSMNISLPTWSLIGLPASGDINLKTFWGDSTVNICMYEKLGSKRQHQIDSKRYVFGLKVEYLGQESRGTESDEEEDILRWSGRRYIDQEVVGTPFLPSSESQLFDVPSIDEESYMDQYFFDAEQPQVGNDLALRQNIPSYAMDLLSAIDNKCPAWLELFTSRGNYTVAFVVNIGGSTMLRSKDDCNDFLAGCTAASLVDNTFSPRLSHTERLRRMVGFVLTVPDKDGLVDSGRLFIFKQRRRNFSNEFRRSGEPLLSDKERAHAKLSGFLFRAVSDRHWIEEWVKLTDRCIYFYHPEKRKRSFCVHLSNIIELGRLQQDECPSLSGQFFLVIKTLGRSIYLMFGSEKDCEMFFSATLNQKIQVEGGTDRMNSVDSDSSFSSLSLSLVDNPADEFLHRSTMWNCQKRLILNGGKFLFRHPAVPPDPLRLVEDALKQALDSVNNGDEVEQRRIFLDSTAMLKQADVRALSDTSKLVFFLNLYHLMIMHAYLVIGPPGWSLQWISYFNNIAYQVSDDILSFAELEHCILRNNMSHPSQFMSRFVIPRSHYSMAIATIDFRINFALNCGSLSNPSSVVVFKESSLDSQLDAVSREYLKSVSVTRKSGRKINIDIPRICEWFLGDFGGSEDELLKNVGPYLSDWQRKELSTCWLSESQCYDTTFITIRYQPFNFECRPLTLANF